MFTEHHMKNNISVSNYYFNFTYEVLPIIIIFCYFDDDVGAGGVAKSLSSSTFFLALLCLFW